MNTTENLIFSTISEILVQILDLDRIEITMETYIIRELGAESIDLMEMAVSLNEHFNLEVDEAMIFLKPLRMIVEKASETGGEEAIVAAMAENFHFLSPERCIEIAHDLPHGPVLKVKDLVQYIGRHTSAEVHHVG